MKYYYLISGLPDIQLEDNKLSQSLAAFKEELSTVLSDKDYQLIKIVFFQYDNENLLSVLNGKSDVLVNELGMFSLNEMIEFTQVLKEDESAKNAQIPSYFRTFIPAYINETSLQEGILWENQLSSLYYAYATQSENKFLADWFSFNLTVNNIITAYSCRKYGFDIQKAIIGEDEMSEIIRTTNSRDYGLTGVFDYLDDVLRLLDETNMLEREKKIDQLRWKYLEEKTFFHYFTIEKVLSHVLKMQIMTRWQVLNKDFGGQVFREMIEAMKESVELN